MQFQNPARAPGFFEGKRFGEYRARKFHGGRKALSSKFNTACLHLPEGAPVPGTADEIRVGKTLATLAVDFMKFSRPALMPGIKNLMDEKWKAGRKETRVTPKKQ